MVNATILSTLSIPLESETTRSEDSELLPVSWEYPLMSDATCKVAKLWRRHRDPIQRD